MIGSVNDGDGFVVSVEGAAEVHFLTGYGFKGEFIVFVRVFLSVLDEFGLWIVSDGDHIALCKAPTMIVGVSRAVDVVPGVAIV